MFLIKHISTSNNIIRKGAKNSDKEVQDFVEYLNKEHKEVFVAALYSKTKK